MRVLAWTCAFLALAGGALARTYGRCELANDLRAFGVRQDHISTWVCIAYHESRFNTAANNPHSGDHGIFQISELYWCGHGKACNLQCSDLRNDDIRDDLRCALRVHEEHTRLQGDGFMAWVVYPQHCRGNTKKYVIGCERSAKLGLEDDNPVSPDYQPQNKSYVQTYGNVPSYLNIASLFQGRHSKMYDEHRIEDKDWYNYKHDKVDELKLPEFNKPREDRPKASRPPVSTTTTTTTYVPPIKPWKFIESNQFRKKTQPPEPVTSRPTMKQEYNWNAFDRYTPNSLSFRPPVESTTRKSLANVTPDTSSKAKSLTASYKSSTAAATAKSVSTTNTPYKYVGFTSRPTSRPAFANVTNKSWPSDVFRSTFSTSTLRPFAFTTKTTRISTTAAPRATKSAFESSTTKRSSTTRSYPTSTLRHPSRTPVTNQPAERRSTRSTQSIFDLYLNPTKPPKLPDYSFSRGSGRFKLNIFNSGTTTPATKVK